MFKHLESRVNSRKPYYVTCIAFCRSFLGATFTHTYMPNYRKNLLWLGDLKHAKAELVFDLAMQVPKWQAKSCHIDACAVLRVAFFLKLL
jgi:hypothetical protein